MHLGYVSQSTYNSFQIPERGNRGKNECMGIGTVALKKPKRCAEKLEVRFDCKREIDNYSRMYYVFLYIIKFT